jgi:putative aldouronate transport system substrate-binding protein
MRRMKKTGILMTLLMSTCLMFGACSKTSNETATGDSSNSTSNGTESGTSTETGSNEAVSDEVFNITMMQELFSDSVPDLNNAWYTYLKENLGYQLDVNFVPTQSYTDKITTTIAGGDLPMVISANSSVLKNQGILGMIEEDEFWNLTDIIKEYPNLYEFVGAERWTTSSIEGVNWGIPRLRVLPRNGGVIRQDWLEALNLSMPTTFDELYDVLYAFTYNDPDGNGTDDTIGLVTCYTGTGNRGWNGFQTLAVAFGAPNGWGYIDGKMVPDFGTEEHLNAMKYIKKLYDNGVMNLNFNEITAEDRKTEYKSGKYGAVFCVIDDISSLQNDLVQAVPTAKSEVLSTLTQSGSEEPRVCATSGYNGLIMFPKCGEGTIQTEEELRKVLSFYDALCTEEYQNLINFGIEGIHYEVVDGVRTALTNESGNTLLSVDMGDIEQILPTAAYVRKDDDNDMLKELYDQIEYRMDYVVLDDTTGLTSDTYNEMSGDLDTFMMDTCVNFVIGSIDEAGYWDAYQTWLDEGGQACIDEYTEQYEAYRK